MSEPELCVLFEVADLACAIPAKLVVRLAVAEEADLRPVAPAAGHPALLGLVRVGGEPFAGWDLGALLLRPAQKAAWIALRLPGPGGPVAVALRTGPCTGVALVRPLAGLPPALFSTRSDAFRGVFEAPGAASVEAEADGAGGASRPVRVGLLFDAERLLETAELARSGALLEAR